MPIPQSSAIIFFATGAMGPNYAPYSIYLSRAMKRETLLALAVGVILSTSSSVDGVTIETGGRGELDEIGFTVDFGSVSFVSDLSSGGLRFNPVTSGGTQILADALSLTTESELKFDWSVADASSATEQSVYQILKLNPTVISFHNGAGTGTASGSVSRQIGHSSYQLQIFILSKPNYDCFSHQREGGVASRHLYFSRCKDRYRKRIRESTFRKGGGLLICSLVTFDLCGCPPLLNI